MPEEQVLVTKYICNRCGSSWFPRPLLNPTPPGVCPKCKSTYWNRPRKYKIRRRE